MYLEQLTVPMLNYLFLCCDKILDESNLRKERFILAHSLRMQSITAGKAWWPEDETEGYFVPTANSTER